MKAGNELIKDMELGGILWVREWEGEKTERGGEEGGRYFKICKGIEAPWLFRFGVLCLM